MSKNDGLFRQEKIEKYISPEEFLAKRFRTDPMCGNYQDDEQK